MSPIALQRVLVVGATSSLAQALCHSFAKTGYLLVLAGRDADELQLMGNDLVTRYGASVNLIIADFNDEDFYCQRLFEEAGDIDHIVLATGDMGSGDAADLSNLDYTMRINYTVPAQIATLAALQFASRWRQERGLRRCIVLISSVAGDRGRQSNYAYGSAKAALTTFASGLRNRFCKQGVHVMTVKPGFIDTPMTWDMKSPLIASREYVAQKIARAMRKRKNVVYVPFFWRYIMLIIQHIPEAIFKRLSL